ncbi:polysaccharide pyruvyl transferase family protein [Blautia schinkii]|nr:polysaccharide pyruvyl transferase family protein [Blautia schinkii]
MKKIGIVTIYDLSNYGNRLQNYAVKKVLSEVYDGTVKEINVVNHFLMLKNLMQYRRLSYIRMLKFYRFSAGSRNIEYLCDYNDKEYDYVICGSDQLWNPYWAGNDFMFATFAEKEKRIAYAASFGVSEIPEEKKNQYIKYLSEMKVISVREEAGAKIVKELTGREAKVLIDPTLMLDRADWTSVASKPKHFQKKAYIMTYFLGGIDSEYSEYIKKIAEEMKCEIVKLEQGNNYWNVVGPAEFIWLIEHCSLFCTDSFHGSIFSILMEVPFVVFKRKSSIGSMGSRIDTLLKKFLLEDRRYNHESTEKILNVNYSHVPVILEEERKKAYEFLNSAVQV